MFEHGDWQFDVDIHPADWRFPAGRSWIAGWVHSRSGRAAADVRAWIDDRPFLGLCGLPRPEIEQRFLGRDGPPHAGFSFLLDPHRDARRLRLEVFAPGGGWEPIHERDIAVAPDAAPPPKRPQLGPELADLVIGLLRARRAQPHVSWAALAEEVVAAHRSAPLNTLPNPPFFGALEEPTTTGRMRYGRLVVTGWLAHRERKITRLTGWADPLQPVPLLHGMPRHDVTGLFTGLRDAERSQFLGHVDVPAGLPQPVSLRIFAELDDGHRELVFNRRFRPQALTGGEATLPPFSALTFLRAATALHFAARRHRLRRQSWPVLFAALRQAWWTYAAEAPPPRRPEASRPVRRALVVRSEPRSVVIVTHNLNFEGAPLFILEYARHLATLPGWTVRVAAPRDGPLRAEFARAGLPVEIVDVAPVLAAATTAAFDRAIAELAARTAWDTADLIVGNTLESFWVVHLARHLGRPSLLYIHESVAAHRYFAMLLAPPVIRRVEEAFHLATRVAFIAGASRAVYARLERHRNFRLLPSWIDLARPARFAADNDPQELRRRHGVPADAVVFANIGSVCERKGQHVFIRALDLLNRELAAAGRPHPPLYSVLVGARPGAYLDSLRLEIALHGRATVRFVDETPQPFDFYRLSDILVCSSFEEAFPRVLMEAAAFRMPIVSTDVYGVTEMLGPDEAWLVPPGDPARLAGAMRGALEAHLAGDRTRAERAHRTVAERYDAVRSLPLHAALAAETAARRRT